MATMAPLSTPTRQPFGLLNDTKLRNLQSIKNRQNGITPNSAPSLKRRAPSPELSDSENVDPNIADAMGKRKRAAFDDDVSLSKPSRYGVYIIPAPTKPSIQISTTTPRVESLQKPAALPMSAPAAAGRSPTRGKRMGLMKAGKRFAPPSFGSKSPSISITAALKGTLANKRAKRSRTIEETMPKSWSFEIFEETEETQDYRMNEWTMTQSATILDISDDERKAQEKSDKGKENVDPNDVFAPAVSATVATTVFTSKPVTHDEPRTPLGDLNVSKYYGEGLDATSVVLVHEDVEEQATPVLLPPHEETAVAQQSATDFTFESQEKLLSADMVKPLDTSEIGVLLASSTPIWEDAQPVAAAVDTELPPSADPCSIDIWESESAKDENEKDEMKFDDNGAFALQEL